MEDKDVKAVLRMCGLMEDSNDEASSDRQYSRDEVIPRLMNITLQCLGTIRTLVIEQEKVRVSKDCNDIDGTCRDDGKENRLQREMFDGAVRALSDTILSGQEINALDPSKDLIESFPSSYTLREPSFLMLHWAITKDGLQSSRSHGDEDEQQFQLDTIHKILEYFPDTISELDKKGQHYMVYVIRTNSVPLFEELLRYNRRLAKLRDGSGKMLIHYCVSYAMTPELLYCVTAAMGKSLTELVTSCFDDRGNLPIHGCMQGNSTVQIVKEILFANTEAVKVPNKDGLYPLHLSASGDDLEKVKCVLSAYPHAINVVDNNGWLPIQHAAFACKSVEIVQYLHQVFPDSVKRPHQSGRLPLHYAAVNCLSSKVVKYLIDAYPEGARYYDANQRLPLHNAIARCVYMTPARLRCIRLLLDTYPHGASIAGKDGRTPLDIARRDGHGDLTLRLLLRADPLQDPEAYGEISYLASKGKYKDRYD